MTDMTTEVSEGSVLRALDEAVVTAVLNNGGQTNARKPSHRIRFHWPPHPVSYEYHVHATDWTGHATFEAHHESFSVRVAHTPNGYFGRCDEIWHEDRGETLEEMLANLRASAEPLFQRQLAISDALGKPGVRFTGTVRDLEPIGHLKLLYCSDRDVAQEAQTEIERHSHHPDYLPGLLFILQDTRHPNRRSAQWCVLDLFEGLPNFVTDEAGEKAAVDAMRNLIWDAEDDYARTIYKAGVVLGGHIPHLYGGPTLLECLDAPSKIGRRSAIHGLFHVVEWIPEVRDTVVDALRIHADKESEPSLRRFALAMALDIERGDNDHIPEPLFEEEQ
jgi:hypothetical protein